MKRKNKDAEMPEKKSKIRKEKDGKKVWWLNKVIKIVSCIITYFHYLYIYF